MTKITSFTSDILSIRKAALCAAIAIASVSTASADTVFSFNIPAGATTRIQGYESRSDSFNFYTDYNAAVKWDMGWGRVAGEWGKDNPATTGTRQFIYRNLNDGGILEAGQSLLDPTVTIGRNAWSWGGTSTQYEGYVGLLDNTGNGYVLSFNRAGSVAFYEVGNGIHSAWVLKGSAFDTGFAQGSGTAFARDISFTVSNDGLSFVLTQGEDSANGSYQLASSDAHYNLTTIVIGAKMPANEEFLFRSLDVDGGVIPEASTYALFLAAGGALVAAVSCRKRARAA